MLWLDKSSTFNTVNCANAGAKAAAPAGGAAKEDGAGSAKFSRMGGLLQPYKDITKGFSILRPNGWNEFQVCARSLLPEPRLPRARTAQATDAASLFPRGLTPKKPSSSYCVAYL